MLRGKGYKSIGNIKDKKKAENIEIRTNFNQIFENHSPDTEKYNKAIIVFQKIIFLKI